MNWKDPEEVKRYNRRYYHKHPSRRIKNRMRMRKVRAKLKAKGRSIINQPPQL